MKRVIEYRKLLGVDKNVTLSELKTLYRNTMKDAHPDKFVNDEAGQLAAEERSKAVITAYHFLVSINHETHEKNKELYNETVATSNILDYTFEKEVLTIEHLNGEKYEYIGVPRNVYIKMVNSESYNRFAKRHIYGKFIFRKAISTVKE